MKVSWKWLNEIIDLKDIKLNIITETLTLAGFEIESIYEVVNTTTNFKDIIIDVNITANRKDTFSLIGIGREIGILLDRPFINKSEQRQIASHYTKQNFIDIIQKNICKSLNNIQLTVITNVENTISPQWLQNYLHSYNIEAKHLLKDCIEYINIKWGQDIEIFDISNLEQSTISINDIYIKNEKNEIDKFIDPSNIFNKVQLELLKYKNLTLSTIGIKTNEKFSCNLNTSTIIVCGTICKTEYIKNITEKLALKTEKSIKHLNNVLQCDFINAYKEIITLISTFTKGNIGKCYEYHNFQYTPHKIIVHKNKINQVLGPTNNSYNKFISVKKITRILHQLQFKPTYNNIKKTFHITVPEYRRYDIQRSIDVIEEIGRIYGFEKFYSPLKSKIKPGSISKQTKIILKIRKILRDLGINEIVHYSLQDKIHNISIVNPLTEEQSSLQDNLINNLLEVQKHNINQKNFNIEIFEIGRVFKKNMQWPSYINKAENVHLACLISRTNFSRQSWSNKPEKLTWFQAKGIIEEFFEKLSSEVIWKQLDLSTQTTISSTSVHLFNPKRTAIICNKITHEEIGVFGELNNYQHNYSTYIFEINLSYLIKTINIINHLNHIIKPYSLYPSVVRDICITLHQNENIDLIYNKIVEQNNNLLESVEIFNEYQHRNKNNYIYRNIGLRITYRSHERTLNDIDLENINKEVRLLLKYQII